MKRTCLGFTLIELLIATSITAILFSLGMAQYMKFNRQQILQQAALELKTNLTQARNMALAGKKTCTGGFDGILVEAVDAERYKISSSCNGMTQKVEIRVYKLPQGVKRTGGLGSPGILFKAVTGGTNLIINQTITLSFQGVGTTGVIVFQSGRIELVP